VNKPLRIAYFPDSYLEVNGVAMTSNQLTSFVRRKGYPFFCVFAGKGTKVTQDANITFVSLKRSPLSFRVDEDLKYDPFFQRHVGLVRRELEKFQPDVIHITGVNDVSIIGVYLAWKMDIALLGSWHTNIHQFAASRLSKMLRFAPDKVRSSITGFIEKKILDGAKLYYQIPQILLAPNQELIDMLEEGTGRTARLMLRGVDTKLFSPNKRTIDDGILRIGYVGRLRAEKNVRMLAAIEKALIVAGKSKFEFLIVGEGDERSWLEANMKTAKFTGFLQGGQLSEAYANMDIFVFPSETDSFGNVPQEAMASGVPAIVTDKGGPKFMIIKGKTGFIAKDLQEFVDPILLLMDDPEMLAEMKKDSLEFAKKRSWDSVFEGVYEAYGETKKFLDNKKRLRKVN
jgi:phosphatidylinositol alpha 1,6-mannosyltransferase